VREKEKKNTPFSLFLYMRAYIRYRTCELTSHRPSIERYARQRKVSLWEVRHDSFL